MLATIAPSGRQHEIRHGGQRAVVVEVGGGLREYAVDGFPVVDGFGVDELAASGRGQLLAPWPNRLAGGRYEFDGREHQLPLSEPGRRNAVHGLVRWNAWEPLETRPSSVRLGHVLWPQIGYPFTLAMEALYELSDEGLAVSAAVENAGRGPAPFGFGQHPYVRAAMGAIDGTLLRIPAATWMEADERQIPTGRMLSVAGTVCDFRVSRPIGQTRLDTAFTDLDRADDGLARVELAAPGGDRRTIVWLDGTFDYVMVFTGDTLGDRARQSVAVEPMTCAPDAFNSGRGLRVLDPGERLVMRWGIGVGP